MTYQTSSAFRLFQSLTPPVPAESAFTFRYIFLLRSCRSMDAFIISSLPPNIVRRLLTAGSLCSLDVSSGSSVVRTHPPPSRLSTHFPLFTVIESTLLQKFLPGARRASPVARYALVTVLSLPPRRSDSPYQSVFG